MKKFRNIMLCILILSATLIILGCTVYNYKIGPVSKSNEMVEVTIPSGTSMSGIAKLLQEKGLVRDKNFFLIYTKLFRVTSIKASTYQLSPDMGVKKIVSILEEGNSYNPNTVSITFKEGINMRRVAKLIAQNTNITEKEVFACLEDEAYLDSLIQEYWFLTDEIKNKDIYYSLEGYLFPDTYQFASKDVTIQEIFAKMLKQTGKVLDPYQEEIKQTGYSVHQLLTLASIVELEGINDDNRAMIASVFYNRLEVKMSLGSDVTSYYGVKVDMNERDLYRSELEDKNPYNTRAQGMEGKLPVGPICLISKNSIIASIEPKSTDYLYFVADKYRNVFFTKTYKEHTAKCEEIKAKGDWITW